MSYLWNDLNLLHVLTFYLLIMFVAGIWRRVRQYGEFGRLALSMPQRWPRLLKLIKEHRTIFMTFKTVAPSVLMLTLSLIQFLLSNRLLPHADVTLVKLFSNNFLWPITSLLGAGLLTYDIYFLIVVDEIDRPMLEKNFDQAEFWLTSKAASVVKFFTLGRINPRGMVAQEVREALVYASGTVNQSLWLISLSTGLRIGFGVSLWIVWVWG